VGAQTGSGPPLPPPPGAPAGSSDAEPSTKRPPTKPRSTKPRSTKPRASGTAKAGSRAKAGADGGLADDVKDIGVGFAKDMLTTADGRRTLRTVFGALFGKK
jgi:hypothetical protein